MMDPQSFPLLVKNTLSKENRNRLARGPERYVQAIREANENLSGLTRRQRYDHELYHFLSGRISPHVGRFLMQKGISPEVLDPVLRNRRTLLQFFRAMPSSYCFFELEVAADTQPGRNVQTNDITDLVFLSVAIPYSDIVVTEKFWTSVAKQRKLDEEYKTTILEARSISELSDYL